MSDPAATLRCSALLARLVLDYDTTETLGTVDALLVDIRQAQVVGIVCKAGLMGRQKHAFAWSQLASIGRDSLMIRAQAAEANLAAAQSAMGLEVWTDAGNKVGHVVDFELYPETGEVVRYVFAAGDLKESPEFYGLVPSSILSAGSKRVMISAQAIDTAEQQFVGPSAATQAALGEHEQQEWRSLTQSAQTLAQKLQHSTQQIKDYTQERLPELTDKVLPDLRDRVIPELTDQLQDRTQQASKTVRQRVDELKNRFQQRQPFSQSSTREPEETIDIQAFEVWEEE